MYENLLMRAKFFFLVYKIIIKMTLCTGKLLIQFVLVE